MKLEYGKRYVTRGGDVSGPLEQNRGGYIPTEFPFFCNKLCTSFRPDGTNLATPGEEDYNDLVAEFVEPPKLQWAKSIRPDKPGIWLMKYPGDKCGAACVNVNDGFLFSKGTWCYLGPVPEIAPAKEQVTLRLYLEEIDEDALSPGDALFKKYWLLPDETPDPEWVETNTYRTEER